MPSLKSCFKMAFPCFVTLSCPLEIFGLHSQSTPLLAAFHSPRCSQVEFLCKWWGRNGEKEVALLLNRTLDLLRILNIIKREVNFILLSYDGLRLKSLRKVILGLSFFFFQSSQLLEFIMYCDTLVSFSQTLGQSFYKEKKLKKHWRE